MYKTIRDRSPLHWKQLIPAQLEPNIRVSVFLSRWYSHLKLEICYFNIRFLLPIFPSSPVPLWLTETFFCRLPLSLSLFSVFLTSNFLSELESRSESAGPRSEWFISPLHVCVYMSDPEHNRPSCSTSNLKVNSFRTMSAFVPCSSCH